MNGLCSADKISYLANVFAICGADSRFVPQEVEALKDIAQRLGVTQEEAAAARRLVASGHYEFALLSDVRARRDNLEDMVMAALADGTIEEREAKPIEKMAKALRFAQVDMDMVATRAQRRLDQLLKQAKPVAGRRPAVAPSAPHSAQPVPAKRRAEAETARDAPCPEPGRAENATDTPPPPAPPPRPARPQAVERCLRCRAAATDAQGYCFGLGETLNVWGCRLLRQPWCAGASWLSAGRFRPSGGFVFDRDAIREQLVSGWARAAQCPHFDPAYVDHALAALPSCAWPGRRWSLRRVEDGGGHGVVLAVRQHRHGCVLHTKRTVAGVEPVGDALARRVIRDACRTAGRDGVAHLFKRPATR